jgi:hypothetical protein
MVCNVDAKSALDWKATPTMAFHDLRIGDNDFSEPPVVRGRLKTCQLQPKAVYFASSRNGEV